MILRYKHVLFLFLSCSVFRCCLFLFSRQANTPLYLFCAVMCCLCFVFLFVMSWISYRDPVRSQLGIRDTISISDIQCRDFTMSLLIELKLFSFLNLSVPPRSSTTISVPQTRGSRKPSLLLVSQRLRRLVAFKVDRAYHPIPSMPESVTPLSCRVSRA